MENNNSGIVQTLGQGASEVHVNDITPSGEEAVKAETPKVEEVQQVEQKEDKVFASKFAALSRKEKAIKQREAELERRMKELESKLAPKQQEEVVAPKEELPLEYMIKKDPFGVLKDKFGLDLDTLVNIAMNDGKPTQDLQLQLLRQEIESSTKKELEAIKAQLKAKEEAEIEAQKRAEEDRHKQTIANFMEEVANFVDAKPEDYELIRAEEAHDLIYDVIAEHFENTKNPETGMGEILDIKVAADEVENYLLAEAKRRLELNKIKKAVAPQIAAKEELSKVKQASPTLSNSLSQVQSTDKGSALKSKDESLLEAAKLLKWRE